MDASRRRKSTGSYFIVGSVVVGAVVVLTLFAGTRRDLPAADEPGTAAAYDPVRAGEPLPSGFRQVLPRDGIRPVYEPRFVTAESSGWDPDSLVIGVEIDGEAKAYPVAFLNRREMVIDSLAGIPILVTW